MANGTYSFQDVTATIAGVTGIVEIGYGAGVAKDGITIAMTQPRNNLVASADGEYMHSLRMDKTGTITIRTLYNADVNAKLQAMLDLQALSSSAWGQNVITIRNKGNEDVIVARGVAFQGQPEKNFAEDGGMMEWAFDCGKIDVLTGTY